MAIRKLIFTSCWMVTLTAQAAPIEFPVYQTGDNWTYRITTQEGQKGKSEIATWTITKVGVTEVFYDIASESNPNKGIASEKSELDWTEKKYINGKSMVVAKPLDFPLEIGKQWSFTFDSTDVLKKSLIMQYKVVGIERINVKAGIFDAIKIEAYGKWSTQVPISYAAFGGIYLDPQKSTSVIGMTSNGSETLAGDSYETIWYSPEIKRWVRVVKENYGPDNKLIRRYTADLQKHQTN